MKINLLSSIQNDSLQIGDIAFFTPTDTTTGSPSLSLTYAEFNNGFTSITRIGKIDIIGPGYITINNPEATPGVADFIMFSKDKQINNAGLLGYYAEVKLTNNSTEPAELFTIASEVITSSK